MRVLSLCSRQGRGASYGAFSDSLSRLRRSGVAIVDPDGLGKPVGARASFTEA